MQTFSEQIKSEICVNLIKNLDNCQIVFETILKVSGEYVLSTPNFYNVYTVYPSIVKFIHEYCLFNHLKESILYSNRNVSKSQRRKYLVRIEFDNDPYSLMNFSNNANSKKADHAQFIIGMFLAVGSVTDITKSSHLEFRCNNEYEQKQLVKSLKIFHFSPKLTYHKNKFIVYFKKNQELSDMMKLLGANQSLYQMEEKKIQSDFVNNYQRLINLEVSNLRKSTYASVEQSNICKIIKSSIYYNNLNEREKLYCTIRAKNKEASMSNICELMNQTLPSSQQITKGGLSHVVKRIKELYNLI